MSSRFFFSFLQTIIACVRVYYGDSSDCNYCGEIKIRLSAPLFIYENRDLVQRVFTKRAARIIQPRPNCLRSSRLLGVDRLLIREISKCYLSGERRVMWSAPARNGKPQAGYPWPLLRGKGSTFCRACTRDDNDRAGDIVRTCRDYVIGRSRNVRCYGYAASDFPWISIETPARALSSQFTLFSLPPTLRARALIGDVYFNCVIHNVAPGVRE